MKRTLLRGGGTGVLGLLLLAAAASTSGPREAPGAILPQEAEWSDPVAVPFGLFTGASLLAGDGALRLAGYNVRPYVDDRTGDTRYESDEVWVLERSPDGAWSDPVNVSRSPAAPSEWPTIVEGPGGVLHAVWGERTREIPPPGAPTALFYANNADGAWSDPVSVFEDEDPIGLRDVLPAHFVVDAAGAVHVVLHDFVFNGPEPYQVRYVRRAPDGTWSEPGTLVKGGHPTIALGPSGELVVVYWSSLPVPRDGPRDLEVVRSSDGGESWSDPETIKPLVEDGRFEPVVHPALTVSDDTVHVAWLQDRDFDQVNGYVIRAETLMHAFWTAGAGWSDPAVVVPSQGNENEDHKRAHLVADGSGAIHAVTHYWGTLTGPGGRAGVFRQYYARWDGAAWSAPERLFGSDRTRENVGLAADGDSVHMALILNDVPTELDRTLFLSSRPVRAGGSVSSEPDAEPASALALGPPRPNPARSRVTVGVTAREAAMLDVVDLAGRVVQRRQVGSGERDVALDVSGLAAGRYTVRLRTADGQRTRPFVVVR